MRAVAALLVCLELSGCRQPSKPPALRIDPALEALVPSDAVFLAGANVDAIRDTVVYQKLLSRVPLPQLDSFARETGLDPRKDLKQILSCSNGKTNLFTARGAFRISELEARLEQQGALRISHKNRALFGSEQAAILFLNSTTAVAGPADSLRSIIDGGGGSRGGIPSALRELVRSLPENDQIWVALAGNLAELKLPIPENSNLASIVEVLKTIDNATLGMDLRAGFDSVAEVACKTERDAKFVHDMVKGMVGLGRLNTPDNRPELLKLYDAIQVVQQQNRAKVTANIPTDLADRFLDLWLKR